MLRELLKQTFLFAYDATMSHTILFIYVAIRYIFLLYFGLTYCLGEYLIVFAVSSIWRPVFSVFCSLSIQVYICVLASKHIWVQVGAMKDTLLFQITVNIGADQRIKHVDHIRRDEDRTLLYTSNIPILMTRDDIGRLPFRQKWWGSTSDCNWKTCWNSIPMYPGKTATTPVALVGSSLNRVHLKKHPNGSKWRSWVLEWRGWYVQNAFPADPEKWLLNLIHNLSSDICMTDHLWRRGKTSSMLQVALALLPLEVVLSYNYI